MRAIMKPERPPRAPGADVRKLDQAPWPPGARKQKAAMTTMRRTLSQVRASWTFAGFAGADDVEQGDSPGDGDSEDLAVEEAEGGGGFEDVEDGKSGEDAGEAGGDGGEGGGFSDGDPGPHVEEAGGVAVGFAEEGVLAAIAGAGGGDLGVGHGAEEGEEAADDPDEVDGAGGADGGHHLARDEKDAGADDDADDHGGGVGGGEGARELVRACGVGGFWAIGCWQRSTSAIALNPRRGSPPLPKLRKVFGRNGLSLDLYGIYCLSVER